MYITARSLVSHDQPHVTVDHRTVTQIKDSEVASANMPVRMSSVFPSVCLSDSLYPIDCFYVHVLCFAYILLVG